jgi:tetratricopeptide (TPR) repeat protein
MKHDAAMRAALDRARTLREEARKERDAGKWAQAREQAQRAQALVESGPTEEALAAQVRQVQEELEDEERDLRFVANLEKAYLAQTETVAAQNRFAEEQALPLYREAFRIYGLPVGEGDPAAAAARLFRRPLEVRRVVTAALDEWLYLATGTPRENHEPHLNWLRALVAAELDEGETREVRAACQEPDSTRRRAELKRLAEAADVRRLPPRALVDLARRLQAEQATDSAIRLLRRAWREHPADFWVNEDLGSLVETLGPQGWAEAVRHRTAAVALRPDSPGAHYNLGTVLQAGRQLDEAIACYRQAIDLDPRYFSAHFNLGGVLDAKGRSDEAIVSYRQALDLNPKDARVHYNLGKALEAKGRVDEAIASYRKALDLNPKDARAHTNLGLALQEKGQLDEAIACYRKALDLDPKLTQAHHNLGNALRAKGRPDEAIACYRQAIARSPKYANAHYNLGNLLYARGQLDEAIACYRRVIEIDPKDAKAHVNLGNALGNKGQLHEAIACYRQAIQLAPKLAKAHYGLGHALQKKGQLDEAIACYRRVIEIDTQFAEAHCNLGFALCDKGDFCAGLVAMRTGHELGSRRPGWPYPSVEWVKQLERLVQLDNLLAAISKGKARPAGPTECLELADFCRFPKQVPATAVRFCTEAFTTEPKLAADFQAGHRYRAALAAALAGCGWGQDAAGLDAAERARLRRQALEWLRADLDLWTRELEKGNAQTGQTVAARMQQWLSEPSLADVRDPSGLTELPAEERSLWQAFWADVTALRMRAGPARKQPESQPAPQPDK